MKGVRIAGGSVPGTTHTKPGQPGWTNNQDAFAWRQSEHFLTAVVCDGCGSTPHAEVGAQMGAKIITNLLYDQWRIHPRPLPAILETVAYMATSALSSTLLHLTGESHTECSNQMLRDYLLFTVLGVVMTAQETIIFSLGDGVFALNGEVKVIPPFEDNAPPYLAYRLIPGAYDGPLDFVIRASLPTRDIQSVLLGSDGVVDFIAAADTPIPGKMEPLGPLSQFWTEERCVENPDAIRRRLALANREWVDSGHIRGGLLPDDTTVVVIRHDAHQEE